MNKINLIGRLTAEPELKYTSTNIPNVKFTLAVNRKFVNDKGEREVDFIRCIAWRKNSRNYFSIFYERFSNWNQW